MNKKLGLGGAAIAAVLLAFAPMAMAQNYPPPPGGPGAGPPGPQQDERGFWPRRGLYGGLGLGFGNMAASCEGCDESFNGLGFHFDIGWHLNPQLGIFLDGYGLGVDPDSDGEVLLIQAIATVGVQYWMTPPLWLKAGLGSAQQSVSSDLCDSGDFDCESDTVPGILLAGGYELLHSPNFSIDAELRLGAGFYDEFDGGTVTNLGIQFSVNWHSLFTPAVIVVH